MTTELRAALRALAAPLPPGSAVTVTVPREALLELVDGLPEQQDLAPAGPAAPDRLLDVQEAAARLGLGPRYLYAHADRLPFIVRVGRKVRVSEARLARFLERRR